MEEQASYLAKAYHKYLFAILLEGHERILVHLCKRSNDDSDGQILRNETRNDLQDDFRYTRRVMKLLKSKNPETYMVSSPQLSWCSTWIDLTDDPEIRQSVLVTNINILRQIAPVAYFFASGFTVETWEKEDIGIGNNYLRSLDVLQLSRSFMPSQPNHQYQGATVVTAILYGDVSSFVHLLSEEEFALVCLPNTISLKEIDQRIKCASSNENAVRSLLTQGGCIITILDNVRFKIWTLDAEYERFFED